VYSRWAGQLFNTTEDRPFKLLLRRCRYVHSDANIYGPCSRNDGTERRLDRGSRAAAQPYWERGSNLANLIDDGTIKLPNVSVLARADAAKAHDLSQSEGTVGKVLHKTVYVM
jgi:hypothetical protein